MNTDSLKNLTTPTAPEEKPTFQHYACARHSMRLITSTGKKFAFIAFKLITDDTDIIEYLNSEIKQGLPGITKGKMTVEKEADPMEAFKRKIIAEHEAKLAKLAADKALGITKDMGTTKPPGAADIKPANSNQVAN